MSNSIFQIKESENYILIKALQKELSISAEEQKLQLESIKNHSLRNLIFDFEGVTALDDSILNFLQTANDIIIEKDGFIVVSNVIDAVKEKIEQIDSPQEIHASYTFSEAEDYLYMVELEKELGGLDEDFLE